MPVPVRSCRGGVCEVVVSFGAVRQLALGGPPVSVRLMRKVGPMGASPDGVRGSLCPQDGSVSRLLGQVEGLGRWEVRGVA